MFSLLLFLNRITSWNNYVFTFICRVLKIQPFLHLAAIIIIIILIIITLRAPLSQLLLIREMLLLFYLIRLNKVLNLDQSWRTALIRVPFWFDIERILILLVTLRIEFELV